MATSLVRLSVTAACIVLHSAAHAQESSTHPAAALTEVAIQYGPQFVQLLTEDQLGSIPEPQLAAAERSVVLEDALERYDELRASSASEVRTHRGISIALGVGSGVLGTLGPQSPRTMAAQLLGSALSEASGMIADNLEEESRANMRRLFVNNREAILNELQIDSLDSFRGQPEAAAEAVRRATGVIDDFRNRADTALLREVSESMMIDVLVSSDEEQWNSIAANSADISAVEDRLDDLRDRFGAYQADVGQGLSRLNEAVESIAGDVADLQGAVVNLDDRVTGLEGNQAIIGDFVLSRMTPAERVRAIEGGFLSDQFSCSDGIEACPASTMRDAILEQSRREATVQGIFNDTTFVMRELTAATQIARDLGIPLPDEVTEFTRVANASLSAFAAFKSGQFLPALASITGLFGSPQDVDAQRHRALMGYLQSEFRNINLRLDQVLRNQAILLEAVNDLALETRRSFVELQLQLNNLEFEVERASDLVLRQYWEPWQNCSSVYERAFAVENEPVVSFDPISLTFRRDDAVMAFIQLNHRRLEDCVTRMSSSYDSFLDQQSFGNFVDIRWSISEIDAWIETQALPEASEDLAGFQDSRSRLNRFEEDLFRPIYSLLLEYAASQDTPTMASIAYALAHPIESTEDWSRLREQLRSEQGEAFRPDCEASRYTFTTIMRGICPGRTGPQTPDAAAALLLSSPYLASKVVDMANWTLVVAQFADRQVIVDGELGWRSAADILELARSGELPTNASLGEELIAALIPVLETVIASQAMLYGPLTAEILTDMYLDGGEQAEAALRLLQRNGYLSRNFAQVFLERQYAATSERRGSGGMRPTLTLAHAAYSLATDAQNPNPLLLEGMFGEELGFGLRESDEVPVFHLSAGELSHSFQVPPPFAMSEGRVIWPSTYYELLAARDQLTERLISYRILDDAEPDAQAYLTSVLVGS